MIEYDEEVNTYTSWEDFFVNQFSFLFKAEYDPVYYPSFTNKLPRTSGVYKITNIKNGKVYIGSAINIYNRLRKLGHPNTYSKCLREEWLKNPRNFKIEVIEECNKSLLRDRETFYIQEYASKGEIYNVRKTSGRKRGE